MLRKVFCLTALAGLIFSICFAQYPEESKTYNFENDTAAAITTTVSATTIVKNRTLIHGFTVAPTRSNAYSPYAALYDEASGDTHLVANLKGEAEAGANESRNKEFPRPKTVANGLTIVLGPYSAIILDYSK